MLEITATSKFPKKLDTTDKTVDEINDNYIDD